MKRAVLALLLLAIGCQGATSTPAPFRPEDHVVPAVLAPGPRPPPPSQAQRQHVSRAPQQ